MSTPQLNDQRPTWSTSAAICGFSVSTVALWAGLCAFPQVKPMLKNKHSFVITGVGLATAAYAGQRFTGLTPAETQKRFSYLQAELDQKKIDDAIKAAKKA